MIVLGIESSCDETAAAIVNDKKEILGECVLSQEEHKSYGGVVPEIAARAHLEHIDEIIEKTLKNANIKLSDVDAIAASSGPGLIGGVVIGVMAGKALSLALNKPFIAVNHLEGHLLSPFLKRPGGPVPHLGMVVSGGHTLFVDVRGVGNYRLLGRSLDDAAGEAFDKVGKMLGLPYPGGPEIDRLAAEGDPEAFSFPRALMKEHTANVSFSGLKTAVLYTLPKITKNGDPHGLPRQTLRDLCASFQRAVTDVLIHKALKALRASGHRTLSISGGVSCNRELRSRLKTACDREKVELVLPDFDLTTDNAAMIAYVTCLKARRGLFHSLDEDVDPNLKLTEDLNRSKHSTHS